MLRLNFSEFKDKIKDLPTPVPIHLQKDDFDLITSGKTPPRSRPCATAVPALPVPPVS
jgi:hypothetical protein